MHRESLPLHRTLTAPLNLSGTETLGMSSLRAPKLALARAHSIAASDGCARSTISATKPQVPQC